MSEGTKKPRKMTAKQIQEEQAKAAKEFIGAELDSTRKALQSTQIYGSMFVFALMVTLFSIANGFATNLEPKEAAKIAKGLVAQRLDGAQMEVSNYLREEIPAWITSAPDYAKSQLPVYRESVEETLETEFEKLASESSTTLDEALTGFLKANEDEFKTIILAGQDKETTDEVAKHMKDMFLSYLTESHDGKESIQDKLDKSLAALKEIEKKTTRLATAGDLDPTEKKTRRAIACLFNTIDTNKDAWNLPTKEQSQNTVAEHLTTANSLLPN